MDTKEIKKIIYNTIVDQLGVKVEDINDTSSFANDLGADSLDAVEVTMKLEEEFNIDIPDEELEKDDLKVSDVIDYIMSVKGDDTSSVSSGKFWTKIKE